MGRKYRVGTRGSNLALTQTKMAISRLLLDYPDSEFEIIQIQTSGDKKQGTSQASFGDKKDWVYELELALLKNEIDFAVHSAKDIPPNIEDGTLVTPILYREAPEDIFVGRAVGGRRIAFQELKAGDKIGTASLRRKACLLALNRGLEVEEFRGNVPTRVTKLDQSTTLSGIVLARAGVSRLGVLDRHEYEVIPTDIMLPAMNQGILAVQVRTSDIELQQIFSPLSSPQERSVFQAERACTKRLGGSCNSAVAVYATSPEDVLKIECWVLERNGKEVISGVQIGPLHEAERIGVELAQNLIGRGALRYLD